MAYSTRTISNNIETLLVLAGLMFWPTVNKEKRFLLSKAVISITAVGLSILSRPSAVTHWIAPILRMIVHLKGFKSRLNFFALVMSVAVAVAAFGLLIDTKYYGRGTISWWNFIKFNVLEGISEFYGASPWHYHLIQTIPIFCASMLPLVLLSLSSDYDTSFVLQFIAGSVIFNSLLPHKEFRFLSPIAPLLMILAAHGLCGKRFSAFKKPFLAFMLLSNIIIGVYLSRIHQSGVIKVMDHIRQEIDKDKVKGIHFAMPCHSTPFYGYLNRHVPMTFVTCHPPIGVSRETYLDESDIFQKEPAAHLVRTVDDTTISHVVMFEQLLSRPNVRETLSAKSFEECWRTFNSHWNPDPRRTGDVVVFCRESVK